MSESVIAPPMSEDRDEWKAYWTAQGEPWRTEPKISDGQQKELAERRDTIKPDIEKGVYPFKDVQLTRADIEWLLHEHGPIDWNNEAQRGREGLDLRGAILDGVDLSLLPLACLIGSLSYKERGFFREAKTTTREQRYQAAVSLKHAILLDTHLEGALLSRVHFEGADLEFASLQKSDIVGSYFYGATLRKANLAGANLVRMHVDKETHLSEVSFGNSHEGYASVRDANWGDANLGIVDWASLSVCGEEIQARRPLSRVGKKKVKEEAVEEWRKTTRAYRQLSIALRAQGMNEVADRFAYRAQICHRSLLRRQHKIGAYLWSGFLDVLAGYGFRPARTLLMYLLVIFGYALAFFTLGQSEVHHLSPLGSVIFSITSFHGRGFFPGGLSLDDPLTVIAATEAIIGLLIEVSFIATFTQRFFSR